MIAATNLRNGTRSVQNRRRIGGEFELDWRDLDAPPGPETLPSFRAKHEIWLDTGRSALAVIARQLLQNSKPGKVWLPAYGCESIAAPFRCQGLPIHYYPVGAALDRLDANPGPGDVLLFIHYFGFRNQAALSRLSDFRVDGVCVIEDCVQAALTSEIGNWGDYALTSLRKLLPQPDGALLAANVPILLEPAAADEAFISARLAAKLLRGNAMEDESFLALLAESEASLAADCPRAISWLSRYLASRCDRRMVAERRRSNYADLWHGLCDVRARDGVRALLPLPQAGEVPMGCPVVVAAGRRDALRRHLAAHDIYCPIHWDLSHLNAGGFSAERDLSAAILTLPIDQRYSGGDMAYILSVLSTFCGEGS